MLIKRVIYQATQEQFLDDADHNIVATKMLEEAKQVWLYHIVKKELIVWYMVNEVMG